jgi:hypothetical protein
VPRGGKRRGAGRKKSGLGERTRALAEQAVVRGAKLPLEYMLRVLEDETAPQARRDLMAIQAAPYCHPRLAAVSTSTVNGRDHGGDINITQIFAVPRGSRIDKSGAVTTIDGTAVELEQVEPHHGTPALSDQREMPAPIAEPLPILDIDTTNVTRLDLERAKRDDDPDAA